ncbi:hypothetical protein D915_001480 [Fasciola hepatica]|uniref:Uncharacterized protein n=1 Tax=Fasciola hepatica TaxID=6192 RepID=A0A4E0RIG7_FASHE|nr:hypothetical protein D915_001480 [Fasciola hepatica]
MTSPKPMTEVKSTITNAPTRSPFNCRLPLSTSMPAFSKLNSRRRVTCFNCNIPVGYIPLSSSYLESGLAKLYKLTEGLYDVCAARSAVRSSLLERFLSMNLNSNVHNADRTDSRHRVPKKITLHSMLMQERADDSLDNRMFLPIFLSDAINIRVSRCCSTTDFKEDETDPCGIPHFFKSLGESIHRADNVNCAGCGACLGVRFRPTTMDQKLLASGRRSSRGARSFTRNSIVTLNTYADDESDYMDREFQRPSYACQPLSVNTVEEEGWITLSLERVLVEPLFGLVGLDQFSFRYVGGEMSPMFYGSIEASPLLSQNSATWMWPTRRSITDGMTSTSPRMRHNVGWNKTYYDLERVDKAVPHTLGHGDLVEATVRRLVPIYQNDESTAEQQPSSDGISTTKIKQEL